MITRRGTKTVIAKNLMSADVDADYADKVKETKYLIESLTVAINKHGQRRDKNSQDWGYNGDMGHIVSGLKDLLRFTDSSKYASDKWLTAEQVSLICPACGDKMRAAGITRVRESAIKN